MTYEFAARVVACWIIVNFSLGVARLCANVTRFRVK